VTSSIETSCCTLRPGIGTSSASARATKPSFNQSWSFGLTFATQSRTQWWFVRMRPVGDTKDDEQPEPKRAHESRTFSSHAASGLKPYSFSNMSRGAFSNVHIRPRPLTSWAASDARRRKTETTVRRMRMEFLRKTERRS
jgi:hypothetical protein